MFEKDWIYLWWPQTASVLHSIFDLRQGFHECLKVLKNVVGRIAPSEFGAVSKQDLMLLMAGSQCYTKIHLSVSLCRLRGCRYCRLQCKRCWNIWCCLNSIHCRNRIQHLRSERCCSPEWYIGVSPKGWIASTLFVKLSEGFIMCLSATWPVLLLHCPSLSLSLFVIRGCTCGCKKESVFMLTFPLLTTSASANHWYKHRS